MNNLIKEVDPFKEGNYIMGKNKWTTEELNLFAEQKGYEVFDMPLAGVNLGYKPFKLDNLNDFIFQCKRVVNADISYPILLDCNGSVCDGFHRIARAIIEGKDSIKAIRLLEMPE